MRGFFVEKMADRNKYPPRQHPKKLRLLSLEIFVNRYFLEYVLQIILFLSADILNEYFSPIYVKLEWKTNIRKKRWFASHCQGMPQMFEQRYSLNE